jgi:hypothetical protein
MHPPPPLQATSEDSLSDTTKQLALLRTNAGASAETNLEQLALVSRELDGAKRRLKEVADLRRRLAQEEATGRGLCMPGAGGGHR